MRLHNSVVGAMSPLRGPNGFLPAPITTRDELSLATGNFCATTMNKDYISITSCFLGAALDSLNTYLGGVEDYPGRGLVSARRKVLATYLAVDTIF